jgi:primosomal protein N'
MVEVLDFVPAFIARVKRQYRFRIILKSRQAHGALQQTLRRTQSALGSPPRGYHVSFDVDAQGLV